MAMRRDVSRVEPDALALRALAHPQRLRMLGLLRIEGPATATRLAERLGLNSGATSYHLRQLARHGFIEEDAGRGSKRDRWWRARHEMTNVPLGDAEGEALEAGLAFSQAGLNWKIGQMQLALANHAALPPDWRKASVLSDFIIPLEAEAAEALIGKLHVVLREAMETAPPLGGAYPAGVKPVMVVLHAFPRPPDGEDTP